MTKHPTNEELIATVRAFDAEYPNAPLRKVSLAEIQEEIRQWGLKNFNPEPHHPLLGAQEEIGELSHAHLKQEQGIRGTYAEHHVKKCDAVADAMVFLLHYCSMQTPPIPVMQVLWQTWDKVRQRDWKKNPTSGTVETRGFASSEQCASKFEPRFRVSTGADIKNANGFCVCGKRLQLADDVDTIEDTATKTFFVVHQSCTHKALSTLRAG